MCGRKKLQLVAHQARQMNKECSKVELKLNMLREQLHEMQEDMVANMFNSTLIDQEKAILKDLEKWKQLLELDRVAVKKASGKNPAISVHAPPNDKTLPDPDEDESDPAGIVEITKMASNLLQLGEEEEEEDSGRGAVGVADEVVAFVRDIAMHPETWLDFPLLDDEDD
ncbi:hypothetical protein BC332_12702 [Capsicum chinense]|nr:hypothetical protein BC332_12702 [Capsicum chinense]